ncbi:MAG TPA: FAD-dependent oxidoreductase [Sphingomicrobium sp.]|nr:FAD-dependent oxidoreductase [Sphingomicrobium sp.]
MADVLIVGGGPAGVMAGLLFARAGASVKVIEKHADFFRDFRGDTVHPSTMEIFDQLGLLERFLERPHNRLTEARGTIAGKDYRLGELSRLDTPAPFIAMMPQWDFLDFLRDEAAIYPTFELVMEQPVTGFVEEEGRVTGVRYRDGREERAGKLVIAADGRSSLARALLPVENLGAPMDVFWFRVPKAPGGEMALRGIVSPGTLMALIDRNDYWQVAYIFAKGQGEKLRAGGIEALRTRIEQSAPILGPLDQVLTDMDQMHLLTVELDRLTQWHKPGLLAIGDAAHAMSPAGGIGINLAIQDAVAAANILAEPLARGDNVDHLLHKVQDRRMFPTRLVQAGQRAAQNRIIANVLGGAPFTRAPLAIRLLDRFPLLRRIPGRMIGLGIRRERVRSPNAYA